MDVESYEHMDARGKVLSSRSLISLESGFSFGILGNCSMRCSNSCIHAVVRRPTSSIPEVVQRSDECT